jgi:hypothetical protein
VSSVPATDAWHDVVGTYGHFSQASESFALLKVAEHHFEGQTSVVNFDNSGWGGLVTSGL